MAQNHVGHLGIEVLNGARRWFRARVMLRRTLDSKSASSQQVGKARMAYDRATNDLEALVAKLEQAILMSGNVVPVAKRPLHPVPWEKLINLMVQSGAKALHETLNGPETPGGKETVIDAEVVED